MIYKYTVSLRRDIERDIFITQFRRRSAVFIPDLHTLSVLYKRRKFFTKAVEQFIHRDGQLLSHIHIFIGTAHIGIPKVFFADIGHILRRAHTEHFVFSAILHTPVFLIHKQFQGTAFDCNGIFLILDFHCRCPRQIQIKCRCVLYCTFIVICLHTDHAFHRRRDLQCDIHPSKRITALFDMVRRCYQLHHILFHITEIHFLRKKCRNTFLLDPTTVADLHKYPLCL